MGEIVVALSALGGVLVGLSSPWLQERFVHRRARAERLIESRRGPYAGWMAAARAVINQHGRDQELRSLELTGFIASLHAPPQTVAAIDRFIEHVYEPLREERENGPLEDEEWGTWEWNAEKICEEVRKRMIEDTRIL